MINLIDKTDVVVVRMLQRELGITEDGIAGLYTLKIMYEHQQRKIQRRNDKINSLLDDKA